jgi:hypothetical protein
MWGGNPAVNNAGTVNMPPPPAKASMKPARNATPHNVIHNDMSKSNGSIKCDQPVLKRGVRTI